MKSKEMIYGYRYEHFIKMKEEIELAQGVIENYIYIRKLDDLYLVNKKDVSMLEIEKYSYIGKVLGLDLYIEPFILKGDKV